MSVLAIMAMTSIMDTPGPQERVDVPVRRVRSSHTHPFETTAQARDRKKLERQRKKKARADQRRIER